MKSVAYFIPTSYVFEGMRALLIDGIWRQDLLMHALILNLLYFAAGIGVFFLAFSSARKQGILLQSGE